MGWWVTVVKMQARLRGVCLVLGIWVPSSPTQTARQFPLSISCVTVSWYRVSSRGLQDFYRNSLVSILSKPCEANEAFTATVQLVSPRNIIVLVYKRCACLFSLLIVTTITVNAFYMSYVCCRCWIACKFSKHSGAASQTVVREPVLCRAR